MSATQTETRLQSLLDQRDSIQEKHESLMGAANETDGTFTKGQEDQIKIYRDQAVALDSEIEDLTETVERDRKAREASKAIKRQLANNVDGVEVSDDGVIYRDFKSYARDFLITRNSQECSKIASQWGMTHTDIKAAQERLDMLARTPANTLSSNVAGLIPYQHISQIFQVINKSRALVNAASHADLTRGVLNYPVVTTRPVVAVQGTQKTEAGNTGMVVDMVTATASTYLGGGDLSWQAINWSTPNALDLWFDLAAASYALFTETDAATVVSASAFLNNIASPIATTATFAEFMTGVGAGYAEVWANSGRIANTIIIAPDRFGYLLGMTSAAFSQFVSVGQNDVGPLNVVVSRGLNAGEIIVGDISALLCAETPGAPVEMRVVEPAIGGVEVGLIGAFEAVVTDNGAFAAVSTAS